MMHILGPLPKGVYIPIRRVSTSTSQSEDDISDIEALSPTLEVSSAESGNLFM